MGILLRSQLRSLLKRCRTRAIGRRPCTPTVLLLSVLFFPPVRGDDSASRAWKVVVDGHLRGTAFLIDPRGFFLTASHVLRDASGHTLPNAQVVLPTKPSRIFVLQLPVVKDYCTTIGTTTGCVAGIADVAIVQAVNFPQENSFAVQEVDFFPPLAGFRAKAYGFASLFSAELWTAEADVLSRSPPDGTPAVASRDYTGALRISPGISGGPVYGPENTVVALVSSDYFPNGDSISLSDDAIVVPVHIVHDALGDITPRLAVKTLFAKLSQTDALSDVELANDLKHLTNVDIVMLVHEILKSSACNQISVTLLGELFSSCYARRLPDESLSLYGLLCVRHSLRPVAAFARPRMTSILQMAFFEGSYNGILQR